jgi:sigma-E factor negative regulatory protein RseC
MSKKTDYIDHQGVVISAEDGFVTVEILNKSACASCHAKSACSLGDVKAKIIEIEYNYNQLYEPGEVVNVKLKKTLGYRALWFSYVIPLVILLVLLVSLTSAGFSEPVTGIAILSGISLYYIIIWLLKDRIKRDFIFMIEKLK